MDQAEARARRESRIRWRARRGTRELDVLIGRFLDARLSGLDDAGLDALERLLEAQDPELQGWLTGHGAPDDAVLASLVAEVRACPPGA